VIKLVRFLEEELLLGLEWEFGLKDSKKALNLLAFMEEVRKLWLI